MAERQLSGGAVSNVVGDAGGEDVHEVAEDRQAMYRRSATAGGGSAWAAAAAAAGSSACPSVPAPRGCTVVEPSMCRRSDGQPLCGGLWLEIAAGTGPMTAQRDNGLQACVPNEAIHRL